jgi:1-acyl-sn-glycerol-3-phosphate acyltransferase
LKRPLPRPIELIVFVFRLSTMILWMIVSSLVSMPLALVRWKNVENNFLFGKIYGPIARKLMGLRVFVEGAEHLKNRPAIFVANHQSGLDMAALSKPYPKGAVIIGKKELRHIPGFGLMFVAFGNVLIDRKDRADALSGLRDAVERMRRENFSVLIFPEGTRNPSGEGLLPFKKGAFYMAIEAQVPIVPMVCSKLVRLVSFEDKYARSGTLIVKVLPPIPTAGLKMSDVGTLLESTRNAMLEALADASRRAEALDA